MKLTSSPVFVLALLVAIVSPLQGASSRLYVLTVGVGKYAEIPTEYEDVPGLRELESAPNGPWSANRVAKAFSIRNAAYCMELLGREGAFVTRSDILSALDTVIAEAAGATGRSFLVFYFNGHGISEGLGWNHFSVPGDFIGPVPEGDLDVAAEKLISAGEVFDALEGSGVPFLVLLDNCYEGEEESFEGTLLGEDTEGQLNAFLPLLRKMNEFHTPYPVIFSAEPGTTTTAVADPHFDDQSVGPMARRLLLFLAANATKEVTLDSLIAALTDTNSEGKPLQRFDALTDPMVTNVARPALPVSFGKPGEPTTIIRRTGSGEQPDLDGVQEMFEDHEDRLRVVDPPGEMALKIKGVPGDFVTRGRSYDIASTAEDMTSFAIPKGRAFTLNFETSDGLLGSLSLDAPVGEVFAKTNGFVKGGDFNPWDEQYGVGVSLGGRSGTIESTTVEIKQVNYESGELAEVEFNFTQKSEGSEAISGSALVRW